MRLLVFLFPALLSMAVAQSGMGYTSIYFSSGVNMLNFNSLNEQLEENNLPKVNNLAYGGTVGYYGVVEGKVMIGVEGSIITNNKVTDSLRNTMTGGYALFQVGYSIVHKRRLEIFPLIGVGYGQVNINIRDKRPDGTFANYFNQQPNVRQLIGRGPVIHVGAGIHYRLGQRNGYYIGARAGYINMGNSGWRFSQGLLIDAPATAGSNLYLNFTVGMFLHDLY